MTHKDAGQAGSGEQVIQGVFTRNGQAVVCGIPDESHNCDAMGCSSVEHVLWRGPHVVDEKPPRDAMTDWRNGENMAVQNKRQSFEDLVDVVTGKPLDPMQRTYGGVTREQFEALSASLAAREAECRVKAVALKSLSAENATLRAIASRGKL